MSEWILTYFWPILGGSVLIPVMLCTWHRVVYGAAYIPGQSAPLDVVRFNRWDRILHWIRLVTFVIAMVCGALALEKVAGGRLFGGIHESVVRLFLLASIIALVYYFKDMLPRSYDREWLAHNGGYFSRFHESYPAGRFNAGQKICFWLTIILVLVAYISGDNLRGGGNAMMALHIISSLILMAMIIVHAYLGTLANPGTGGVIINGMVSEKWALHHHPRWTYKKVG